MCSLQTHMFLLSLCHHKFYMCMCRISDDVDRQGNNSTNPSKTGKEENSSIGIERKTKSKREQISMKR